MAKINEKTIEAMLKSGKPDDEIIKILAANSELVDRKIEEIKLRIERLWGLIGENSNTAITVAVGDIDDIRKEFTDLKTLLQEQSVPEPKEQLPATPTEGIKEMPTTIEKPLQDEKQAEEIAKI